MDFMKEAIIKFDECFAFEKKNTYNKKKFEEFTKMQIKIVSDNGKQEIRSVKQFSIFSLRAIANPQDPQENESTKNNTGNIQKKKMTMNNKKSDFSSKNWDDMLEEEEEEEKEEEEETVQMKIKIAPISLFKAVLKSGFAIHHRCFSGILERKDLSANTKEELVKLLLEHQYILPKDAYLILFETEKNPEVINRLLDIIFNCEKNSKNVPIEQGKSPLFKKGVLTTACIYHGTNFIEKLRQMNFEFNTRDMYTLFSTDKISSDRKIEIFKFVDKNLRRLCEKFIQKWVLNIDEKSYNGNPIDLNYLQELENLGFLMPYYTWRYFMPFCKDARDFGNTNVRNVSLWLVDRIDPSSKLFTWYWTNRTYWYRNHSEEDEPEMIELSKLIEEKENVQESHRRFLIRQENEQKDRQEFVEVYGKTPEEAMADRDRAQLRGICRYFEQRRCYKTPRNHISKENHFPRDYQGTCTRYHGPIQNTYKLTYAPSDYPFSTVELNDATVCIYFTGYVDSELNAQAQEYIKNKQIPTSHESKVAEIMNKCWWLQYVPGFNGDRIDLAPDGRVSDYHYPYFELMEAICPYRGNSQNLRFMALNTKDGETWGRYYSDISTLFEKEGRFTPYFLQDPMHLVFPLQ